MLTLYLRKEKTTDRETLKLWPQSKKQDVQAYRDEACTHPAIRWPWHSSTKPRKGSRSVMFNCYRWAVVWIEPKQRRASA